MIILVPINDNEKKRLPNAISSMLMQLKLQFMKQNHAVCSFKNNVH